MSSEINESEPSEEPPTYAKILFAKRRLRRQKESDEQVIVRTPILHSRALSEHVTGQRREFMKDKKIRPTEIYVKYENLQFTGAYKERGALNKLLVLLAQRGKQGISGVVAASAGNHAQGLARHATRLKISATIYMPENTPTLKVSRTEQHGAKVKLYGKTFDEAKVEAKQQCVPGSKLEWVHPFADVDVIAGQGTVALEMLEEVPDLDTIIIPIGGGGLISGAAIAAKAYVQRRIGKGKRTKPIDIVGVEAALFPTLYNVRYGKTYFPGGESIAEGIAVKEVEKLTRDIIERQEPAGDGDTKNYTLVDDIVTVKEEWLEEAIGRLIELEKTVVEGAGAAGLAALLQYAQDQDEDGRYFRRYFEGKKVGIILTGGNIDTRLLSNILLRDLLIDEKMARIRVILTDKPRQLFSVLDVLQKENINIVDIYQERVFNERPAKNVVVEIDCEAAREALFVRAMADLGKLGFETTRLHIRRLPAKPRPIWKLVVDLPKPDPEATAKERDERRGKFLHEMFAELRELCVVDDEKERPIVRQTITGVKFKQGQANEDSVEIRGEQRDQDGLKALAKWASENEWGFDAGRTRASPQPRA